MTTHSFCRASFSAPLFALLATGLLLSPAASAKAQQGYSVDDMLNIVSFSISDITKDGKWAAATSQQRRDGLGTDYFRDTDPTYVRATKQSFWLMNIETGERKEIVKAPVTVRAAKWSPDGARLAFFQLRGEFFELQVWERLNGRLRTVPLPPDKYIAENSDINWLTDGQTLVFSLRSNTWKKAAQDTFFAYTRGPVFVQSSSDPFLAWDSIRRMSALRSIAAHDLKSGKTRELAPEQRINSFTVSKDDSLIVVNEDLTEKTAYEAGAGRGNRVRVLQTFGGEPRILFDSTRGQTITWAPDGRRFAYARDGRVFMASVDDVKGAQIAGPAPAASGAGAAGAATGTGAAVGRGAAAPRVQPDTSRAARDSAAKLRFSVSRFSPDGGSVLLSNPEGQWLYDLASKERLFVMKTDTAPGAPRRSVLHWSEDGKRIYLYSTSRTGWQRTVELYDVATRASSTLASDARYYSGLRDLGQGGQLLVNIADGNRPAEPYVADAKLSATRKLVDANPWMRERAFGKTELLDFRDADGATRYGVVHYPINYRQGVRYPTVFIIYEDFFDDTFDATANWLSANGYLVVKPSVGFDIGFPGEAWLKSVTAAANKLIDIGISDSSRLGVHGTSYGGFATNLLITQTSRFKAAINISGKTDMVSFYTDSPRLGIRNMSAAERSQDRIGATLWEQPQKYIANSAILFADRVKTPLLLITGDQDQNVPARNSGEMYYALRRLGKEVVWVNYMNSGHGTPGTNASDFVDYHRRILEWYDKYLKDEKKKAMTSDGPGQ